jgi:CBS domain
MPGADTQFRIARPFLHRGESMRAAAENPGSVRSVRPRAATKGRLTLADPAGHVVTDFLWEQPITVPEELSIDDALRKMIRAGVRALLVVHDEAVTGLITSYDIQGERPCSSSQHLAAAVTMRSRSVTSKLRGSGFQHSIGRRSVARGSRTWPRFSGARRRPMSSSSSVQVRGQAPCAELSRAPGSSASSGTRFDRRAVRRERSGRCRDGPSSRLEGPLPPFNTQTRIVLRHCAHSSRRLPDCIRIVDVAESHVARCPYAAGPGCNTRVRRGPRLPTLK